MAAAKSTQRPADRLLPIPEAALRLGISRTSVYSYFADGRLTPHNIGAPGKTRTRVSEAELNDFIKQSAAPAPVGRKRAA